MNVKQVITTRASVINEKAAQSQSEVCVTMCSCALGGLISTASLPSLVNTGTNILREVWMSV